MYIYKIVIQNFRNFESFEWKPDKNLNVIFGPNGCGKTNLAEAISLVFSSQNYDSYFELSDYYNGDINKKILIQVWLDEISDFPEPMSEHLQHIDSNDVFIFDDSQESSKAVLIFQLENGENHLKEWTYCQSTQQVSCHPRHRKSISFSHIDVDRQPLREIGLQGKSIFYQMAKDVIEGELEVISKEISKYAQQQLTTSSIINEYLSSLKSISKIDIIKQYQLLLKDLNPTWANSGFELGTIIGDAQVSFKRQAKGIQNLFLLFLMKKQLEGAGIVFVEELEQNLEPKHQRYIVNEFRGLKGQLFITSHSPEIISHFDFDKITTISANSSFRFSDILTPEQTKLIHSTKKSAVISSLMASSVLLVEGPSEYDSFPIYSHALGSALNLLDIEVLDVGGKGNFDKYANVFRKLNKKVYILIDNDADATAILNQISESADVIFVAQDSYECLIYGSVEAVLESLNEIVDFQSIKNKLLTITNTPVASLKGRKKYVYDIIAEDKIKIDEVTSYTMLYTYPELMKYALHDSFTTPYFVRSLSNMIIENGVPPFFKKLYTHLNGSTTLSKFDENLYHNVFSLVP